MGIGKAKHTGNAGPVKVHIKKTHFKTLFSQKKGKVDGNRRLTDSALSAHDNEFMFDLTKKLMDGHILRINFFLTRRRAACAARLGATITI